MPMVNLFRYNFVVVFYSQSFINTHFVFNVLHGSKTSKFVYHPNPTMSIVSIVCTFSWVLSRRWKLCCTKIYPQENYSDIKNFPVVFDSQSFFKTHFVFNVLHFLWNEWMNFRKAYFCIRCGNKLLSFLMNSICINFEKNYRIEHILVLS